MRLFGLTILALILFLGSCKKELPGDDSGTPVFFVHGHINDQPLHIVAGDNGYYMRPDFVNDTLDIRSFAGHLGKINCVGDVDCPQSVYFSFREKEKNQGVHLPVENTIYPREVQPRGPASYLFESYKATFTSKSSPSSLGHTWYFGDGEISYDLDPVHYYLDPNDSIVSPTLIVNDAGSGCQSSITYPLHFESICDVDFAVSYNGASLQLIPTPTVGRQELWSYNYGTYMPQSSLPAPSPTDSLLAVCLESKGATSDCISYKCKNVILDTAKVTCVSNFDVVKETVLLKDVQDYSEVTVIWQNEEGVKYYSDAYMQPVESFLEILEVEDYKATPDGLLTKKVSLRYQLRLFGSSETDFVTISSENTVVAIAYPEI